MPDLMAALEASLAAVKDLEGKSDDGKSNGSAGGRQEVSPARQGRREEVTPAPPGRLGRMLPGCAVPTASPGLTRRKQARASPTSTPTASASPTPRTSSGSPSSASRRPGRTCGSARTRAGTCRRRDRRRRAQAVPLPPAMAHAAGLEKFDEMLRFAARCRSCASTSTSS